MTANAGRPDYDATVRDPLLRAGEPLFRLRGQDALAARTIRYWAALAHAEGVDPAVVEQALRQADAFDAWTPRKLPDADHLADHERRQLAYALGRRAWRDAVPTLAIEGALADVRAANEAEAARRHDPANCRHATWTFETHGKRCPGCGAVMIEESVA